MTEMQFKYTGVIEHLLLTVKCEKTLLGRVKLGAVELEWDELSDESLEQCLHTAKCNLKFRELTKRG